MGATTSAEGVPLISTRRMSPSYYRNPAMEVSTSALPSLNANQTRPRLCGMIGIACSGQKLMKREPESIQKLWQTTTCTALFG
jgi:hypothetical protein